MKWKTGFVLVLVILAVVPLGVESVSGMESEWEYVVWSDVTELSVSDDGHVAVLVSASEVSDVYLIANNKQASAVVPPPTVKSTIKLFGSVY